MKPKLFVIDGKVKRLVTGIVDYKGKKVIFTKDRTYAEKDINWPFTGLCQPKSQLARMNERNSENV